MAPGSCATSLDSDAARLVDGRELDGTLLKEVVKRFLRPLKVAVEARTGSIRARRAHERSIRQAPTIDEAIRTLEARWDLQDLSKSLDSDAPENRPVFLLSAGWRSGSTLLQRLVMSSGETLVWGEPYDRACYVQDLARSLRQFTSDYPPDHYILNHHLAEVRQQRAPVVEPTLEGDVDRTAGEADADSDRVGPELAGAWIANMYPHPADLHAAHRAFLLRLFEAPARRAGFRFWGLKEVRLSVQDAFYLRWLFPAARFVFLIRNPYRAYRSYRRLGPWYDRWPDRLILTPRQFGEGWRTLAEGFIGRGSSLGHLVRHEELTSGGASLSELSASLGLDLGDEILGQRVTGRAPVELDPIPAAELRLLRRAVQPLAEELGYQPD